MAQSTVIPVTRRADLQSASGSLRGKATFTVKDPIASRFFQLRPVEWFILEQLSNPISWEELTQRVNDEFAPRKITAQQLESFVAALHREGLATSSAPNQGEVLLQRSRSHLQRQRWSRWSNPLAIRFRGVNLSSTLKRIEPYLGWLFSPACFVISMCVLLFTALYTAIHWPRIAIEMPQVSQWLTAGRLIWVAAAIGLSKVLHELGHAIACHRMGGRCREIGVMLLVFVPCLYCDVSDAWLVRGKWRRIAVSGAGIWVELMLACLGFWVWRLTDPSWIHWLALSLAVTCSINTIFFNGNMLLRYDGYFILADYWEIPNLMEQSRQRLREACLYWTTGIPPQRELRSGAPDRLLIPYAVASIAYRWIVVVLIWWALDGMLRPWGLQVLALGILWLSLLAMTAPPAYQLWQWLLRPRNRAIPMNWRRMSIATLTVAAIFVLAVATPLPNNVTAPGVIQSRHAAPVRALAAGQLQWTAAVGAEIKAGDDIAKLANPEVAREISLAETDRRAAAQAVASLQKLGTADPELERSLVVAEQKLQRAEERLLELEMEHNRLTVRAARDGTLAPSRTRPATDGLAWSGSLLDPSNLGAYVQVNDPIGVVADPTKLEVVVVIAQSQISLVEKSQTAMISPNATMEEVRGEVVDIAEVDSARPPVELVEANLIASAPATNGANGPQSLETLFTVRIALDQPLQLPIGTLARVKIITPRRTLWEQIRRGVAGWLR